MFTGLVQAKGRVEAVRGTGVGVSLEIDASGWDHGSSAGDSIAVGGVCLTVAERPGAGRLRFDVVAETLGRSTLGRLSAGSLVNLERSCRADTLLGGHFVQGHVDAVGRVVEVAGDASDWRVEIEAPAEAMPCIVPKGSVCVEGVSLTVARVLPGSFVVALIPATLERTTLGGLRVGDAVNIETDILARTVVHYLRRFGAGPWGRVGG